MIFSRVSSLFVVPLVDHGTLTFCRLWYVTIASTSLCTLWIASVCAVYWPATFQHHFMSGARKYLPTSCLLSNRRATTSTNHRETQPLPNVPGYLQYPEQVISLARDECNGSKATSRKRRAPDSSAPQQQTAFTPSCSVGRVRRSFTHPLTHPFDLSLYSRDPVHACIRGLQNVWGGRTDKGNRSCWPDAADGHIYQCWYHMNKLGVRGDHPWLNPGLWLSEASADIPKHLIANRRRGLFWKHGNRFRIYILS